MTVLAAPLAAAAGVQPMRVTGRVAALRGLTVLVDDLPLPIGALVQLGTTARRHRGGMAGGAGTPAVTAASAALDDSRPAAPLGEVVGLTKDHAVVMMLGQIIGVRVGDPVVGLQSRQTAAVGESLLGRVIDGLGRPIDSLGPVTESQPAPLSPPPIPALRRRRVTQPMHTGLRAVDLMCTLGRGQRIGIFAGPGVGKSTLLGQIARHAESDVNVIALIGERGREVRDFIEDCLDPAALARSVVVVATGDESPLLRVRAALSACSIAEHFRDAGRDVLLMMDSVTRFAHAQRQIGLSVGEPPATKGYTPSVFAQLSLLLERAGAVESSSSPAPGGGGAAASAAEGASSHSTTRPLDHSATHPGSITALYTILVEGDDLTEPVSDAARGILDGHVILSRRLAQRAHYPAIDVLDSVSRVADDVCDTTHAAARRQAMRLLAVYREIEDLVQIGAYAAGSNPEADASIAYYPRLTELLRQGRDETAPFDQARDRLIKIVLEASDMLQRKKIK
ncbi:MAG: EscN/YscN/HrcN family type III secretion system ATPase [Phycisphaerales bacterium]|nr:EscN/YscN/HrcN family type III secretion system ATPase [Phycisphaerales bacterium]